MLLHWNNLQIGEIGEIGETVTFADVENICFSSQHDANDLAGRKVTEFTDFTDISPFLMISYLIYGYFTDIGEIGDIFSVL